MYRYFIVLLYFWLRSENLQKALHFGVLIFNLSLLRNFANEEKAGNSAVKSYRQLMSFVSSCSVAETVNGMEPIYKLHPRGGAC
jgi:hypothetical protein